MTVRVRRHSFFFGDAGEVDEVEFFLLVVRASEIYLFMQSKLLHLYFGGSSVVIRWLHRILNIRLTLGKVFGRILVLSKLLIGHDSETADRSFLRFVSRVEPLSRLIS